MTSPDCVFLVRALTFALLSVGLTLERNYPGTGAKVLPAVGLIRVASGLGLLFAFSSGWGPISGLEMVSGLAGLNGAFAFLAFWQHVATPSDQCLTSSFSPPA